MVEECVLPESVNKKLDKMYYKIHLYYFLNSQNEKSLKNNIP